MNLAQFLTPERTRCGAHTTSKKRVLEEIAQFISGDVAALNADELFAQLLSRERLGSTGLGHGVAIPHCRLSNCSAIVGALISLDEAIDFEAVDDEPVDLLFALVVPEEATDEHLQALSAVAELFNKPEFRQRLRSAQSGEELYRLATGD